MMKQKPSIMEIFWRSATAHVLRCDVITADCRICADIEGELLSDEYGVGSPPANGNRKILFWSHDSEAEELIHTTREAAINAALEEDAWLGTAFWLFGYARIVIASPQHLAARFVEELLEELDNLGGGEGPGEAAIDSPPGSAAEIERLAGVFIDTVTNIYTPWGCEIVHSELVDVSERTNDARKRQNEEPETAKENSA